MGRAIAKVIAVVGGLVFSFWTGAAFLLDNIGRAETLADLAHHHHDLLKWLVSTPPAYPGIGALAIAGVLCYLLLAGPQSSQPASAHSLAPHPSHDLAPRETAPLVVQPQNHSRSRGTLKSLSARSRKPKRASSTSMHFFRTLNSTAKDVCHSKRGVHFALSSRWSAVSTWPSRRFVIGRRLIDILEQPAAVSTVARESAENDRACVRACVRQLPGLIVTAIGP